MAAAQTTKSLYATVYELSTMRDALPYIILPLIWNCHERKMKNVNIFLPFQRDSSIAPTKQSETCQEKGH
jgi:hypothetical protein